MPSIFADKTFTNSFASLSSEFYSRVQPQLIENTTVASINPDAGKLIGLSTADLMSEEFRQIMACETLPDNAASLATIYSGHQFGSYNPQLGDGRALMVGEIASDNGPWELQLKGSGKTPYSRMGDGRAVLRSSIREYLCSEAMHGLGIPTTRALALGHGSTPVYRETVEQAASVIRMAPSHVRFGHFEYFFYTGQHDKHKELLDYIVNTHFSELAAKPEAERYSEFFREVTHRTARLIAQWQVYGFCHGVMNTDNMSILGLTIDYGPFAFLDDFNPGFICNHSDHAGRYAYNRQIQIGLWNLNALAHSLSGVIDENSLKESLMSYEPTLLESFGDLMYQRLGFNTRKDDDSELLSDLLTQLAQEQRDYTRFFRKLCDEKLDQDSDLVDFFIDRQCFASWLDAYKQRLKHEQSEDALRQRQMKSVNPKYILRNYLAQEAIEKAEKGDYQQVNDLLKVLQSPFEEHPEHEALATTPPEWGKMLEISCSS
ncbi:Uncharacterised protein [BD1-7 clade bacterium]|uniref:Protein nucleotidyltransferase YdiU n=1 Tax=BD1-7 clade bacterium TaxID=2029982 RepID=A0A5S9PTI0_9GAMM|nr:Uncharacterised protein [BD1-7 clade bacterium]